MRTTFQIPAGTLHAHVIRSPHPHADIVSIDAREALAKDGVWAVVTGDDVRKMSDPFLVALKTPVYQWSLAVGRVRYVGEPVALVVAESRYLAEDAGELVQIEYRPLDAMIDPRVACGGSAPMLHTEAKTNEISVRKFTYGDTKSAFERADARVALTVDFPRLSFTPMECYVVVAQYNAADGGYDVLANFQGPFSTHPVMARALRVPGPKLRLRIPPDSGGSFGIKLSVAYRGIACGAERHAQSAAAGFPEPSRAAVWFLHARHPHVLHRLPQAQSATVRGGHPRGLERTSVPLHRLCGHRVRAHGGGRSPTNIGTQQEQVMNKQQTEQDAKQPAKQVYRELVTINGKNVVLAHNEPPVINAGVLEYADIFRMFNIFDEKFSPTNIDKADGTPLRLYTSDRVKVDVSKRRKHDMGFWHRNIDAHEIIFCVKGALKWETEMGVKIMHPGDMLFIPKGIGHRSMLCEDSTDDNVLIELKIADELTYVGDNK